MKIHWFVDHLTTLNLTTRFIQHKGMMS